MPKTLVILQSNYIPWKGYFDLINIADEFMIFDDAQYTRRDWRNRNRIVESGRVNWITIPVRTRGRYTAAIDEIEVTDTSWASAHWRRLQNAYRKMPFYPCYEQLLEAAYEEAADQTHLTAINEIFLRALSKVLEIKTVFGRTRTIETSVNDPTERLVEICVARGAKRYISGPAARDYIDRSAFEAEGIELRYCDYSGYQEYDQGTQEFEHGVSMIDMLMRIGPDARTHLKSRDDPENFLFPDGPAG